MLAIDRTNISGNWPAGHCVHVHAVEERRLRCGIAVTVKLVTLFDVSIVTI